MRFRLYLLAAAAVVPAACGGGPPAPPSLAYSLPTLTNVTYTSGDTASLDLDAGGQTFQLDRTESSTLGAAFTRAPEGVQVSFTVKDYDASQTNPMGAPATADEGGISGPLVVSLDRRGAATVLAQPDLSGGARQFFQPLSVAHLFFPRLPGRGVQVGESWTDTVRFEGRQGDGNLRSSSIMTYTVLGDTLVGERKVLKLAMEGSSEATTTGAMSGMDYTQKVSGSVKGWVLWDLQRALMTEMYGATDATGTMDVSAAPFPLTVHVRGRSRTRLAEEM